MYKYSSGLQPIVLRNKQLKPLGIILNISATHSFYDIAENLVILKFVT